MELASQATFIGRTDSWELLKAEAATVARGGPRVVLVSGDAGIGKSSLVSQFLSTDTGARTLAGGCYGQTSGSLPYSSIVQALRPVRHDTLLHQLSPGETQALSPLLGLTDVEWDERGVWARSRLFEATLNLLDLLSRPRPVTLVVEDLHWVDQATMDLLLFLVANMRTHRILLVGTVRSDEPGSPSWLSDGMQQLRGSPCTSAIELAPLSHQESARLVTQLRADADHRYVDRVVARGEGNPLFLGELVAAGRTDGAGVPRRLRDLMLLRVARLPEPSRLVVKVLATAGEPVHHRLLDAVLSGSVPDLETAVRDAAEASMVTTRAGARLGLHHAILGDAVYEAMLPTERARWHEAFATALADVHSPQRSSADTDALEAHHWQRAGRLERVPEPLSRAASRARKRFANADAARAGETLLTLFEQVPDACRQAGLDRGQVLTDLAAAHRWGATPGRGVECLHAALAARAGDPESQALLLERLAQHLTDLGRGEDAMAVARRATDLAESAPPAVRARVECTLAAMLMHRGEFARSRERCLLALKLVDDSNLWERAHALRVLGVDLVNRGEVDEAIEALETAIELARQLDDPEPLLRSYVNYTYVLEAVGRWEETVTAAAEGLATAETQGLALQLGPLLVANQASAVIAIGDLRRGRDLLQSVVSGPGTPSSSRYAQLRLAEVEVTMGLLEEADARLQSVAGDGRALDSITDGQEALTRALLALARADPGHAYSLARANIDNPQAETDPTVGLNLIAVGLRAVALLAARARVFDSSTDELVRQAAELLDAAQRLADEATLEPCLDVLQLCRLEHQRCVGAQPASEWSALADRLKAHDRGHLAAYAYYRAAEDLAAGGPARATTALRASWELADASGDVWLLRDVSALASHCRITLEPQPEPAAARKEDTVATQLGLTERELDVLELVAQGATNRQVGRALGISERTAAVHVANILTKLRARNRTEAAVLARNLGITMGEER